MAKQVYARLDQDKVDLLDAECEKRNVYRPEIVTAAVLRHLEYGGDLKAELDDLNAKLAKADVAVTQLETNLKCSKALTETQLTKIEVERKRADDGEAKVAELEEQNTTLEEEKTQITALHEAAKNERDSFREAYKKVKQMLDGLIVKIDSLQKQGVWGRLFRPRCVDTGAYLVIDVEDTNEKEAE